MTADPHLLERHIEKLLFERPRGISEHTLIRQLRDEGLAPFADAVLADELHLFQVHFTLFHLLYRLRDRFRRERRWELHISPLNIALYSYQPGRAALAAADPLRSYYLDPKNLDTDRGELGRLLDGFWRRLRAGDERQEALAVLELSEPVDLPTIKRRYRLLAMRHHPDRGGDTGTLQDLNRAMDVLKRCFG